MIIYLLSFPNGKHYVGRTKNSLEQRCTEHKARAVHGHQHPLYHAINKYGWENVKKEVLHLATSHEELVIKELEFILHFNSLANGYNLTINTEIGGDNWEGRRDSEEYNLFVEKMKLLTSGGNNGMYGRKHSKESTDKMKRKAVGRFTLSWFQEKYGEVEGKVRYENRCNNRRGKVTGSQNTSYKGVNTLEFKRDVLSGISKSRLCETYGLASTSFSRRLQDVFGDTSLYRIRGKIRNL